MSEEEVIKYLKNIKDKDLWIRGYVYGKKAIDTALQLLEQKDTRIDELEKALVHEAIKSTEKINKLKNRLKSDIEIGLKELKNEEWYTQKYAVFSNCVEYANEILKMLEE